ncbi:hypothetical protein Zmor_015571 [Zophobas morio]|uniref:Uncharacterized protein n=1 Tax=Zophobas morio TaxID=2755281 RepID=A0AA38MHQ2_9CUCU|nr:hypothetical protein Zmor_015571 [Zophobas morio]
MVSEFNRLGSGEVIKDLLLITNPKLSLISPHPPAKICATVKGGTPQVVKTEFNLSRPDGEGYAVFRRGRIGGPNLPYLVKQPKNGLEIFKSLRKMD